MMRFDQYSTEEQALKAMIVERLEGKEERLLKMFIQHGPEALRENLNVPNDFVWTVVFDHLVFNLDVLKRCVEIFFPFFQEYVLKNGPQALRELFGIQDARYDGVFEKLVDDLIIARGLLFEHVHRHVNAYLKALKEGRGSDIRFQLGLANEKYQPLWEEVVDFLLDAFTREKVTSKQKEETQTLLNLLQSLLSE